MKTKYFLMGSAGSIESLIKLMKNKMYWSEVNLEPTSDKTWSVSNSKGLIDSMRVILKRGRYRLEVTS